MDSLFLCRQEAVWVGGGCNQLLRSVNTTSEAVLDPMRMIRAASVWDAFSTICPFTECK